MSESIELLRSMDRSLKALVKHFADPPTAASDEELDGEYGDPKVKHNPRAWDGDDCRGRQLSQCPPDFLDLFAQYKDWGADKDDAEGKVDDKNRPSSYYGRKDARLARGWARRLREGYEGAGADGTEPAEAPADDDDLPF